MLALAAPAITTMPTTLAALRPAPLFADKVTRKGEIRQSGEKECMTLLQMQVNTYPDASGRTLLAWSGLMVIPDFMPGSLYGYRNHPTAGRGKKEVRYSDQRGTKGSPLPAEKSSKGREESCLLRPER